MIAHIKAVITDPGVVPLPQSRVDFSDIHSSGSGKQNIASMVFVYKNFTCQVVARSALGGMPYRYVKTCVNFQMFLFD